jgi:alpha-galactosidase
LLAIIALSVLNSGCYGRGEQVAPVPSTLQKAKVETVWLDELDISKAQAGAGTSQANKSIDGNPLRINGVEYERGFGTHSPGQFYIKTGKGARSFKALVGIDDEITTTEQGKKQASVEFIVAGDKKLLWRSGVMKAGMPAKEIDLDISGIDILQLRVQEIENINYDHSDWVNARFEVVGERPVALEPQVVKPYILTPEPGPKPRITGAKVFGVRAGNPFLFTVTATGKRPMKFGADGLPEGLELDKASGRITGVVGRRGEYKVKLSAENNFGRVERDFRIIVGDTICLTPPMGWNSWNCWACAVDDEKIRAAAKAMVETGLINHGWTYINIDDCWAVKLDSNDPVVGGKPRDENGMLLANKKFPDMKALTDYIHSLGLKAGIYISPGPMTCAGFEGSYQHEFEDAAQFATWGFDYLKYDWCGYSQVAKNHSLEELKKPYKLMREVLNKVNRDIVYSLCQYGWGDVWQWGEEVGGNCWRTGGDLFDSWIGMTKAGFSQDKCSPYAGPGHWNDPDMLVVGKVGWGPNLHASKLSADEQYTHISLWCLLSSPLLIGCNLSDMDEFTLNLLTNDEVLEVNQDPLGQQARRVSKNGLLEVWAKDMEDGSKAVGLFNRDDFEIREVGIDFSALGIEGKSAEWRIRDLWRQKDLGVFDGKFSAKVPVHGVVLVKISKR